MSRIPNDDTYNLACQMALYTGPSLLGMPAGNDRALLMGLQHGCFELINQIGMRMCKLPCVRFIDVQREGLWLAEQLANAYMREADCLTDVWVQQQLRAYILRSLRCMFVLTDEQYLTLRNTINDWAIMMHEFVVYTYRYGSEKLIPA